MAEKRYALGEILITEQQIRERVAQMGAQISEDYRGRELLTIGILKGSVPFMADLVRAIDNPLQMDFMSVSSYGSSTESSGVVRILKDLDTDITGRDVLIIEDIIDSGLTLKYLKETLWSRKPASLKICTFLDKPSRRTVDLDVDYRGFAVEDLFIVGYGLDVNQHYRNLPYITSVVELPQQK